MPQKHDGAVYWRYCSTSNCTAAALGPCVGRLGMTVCQLSRLTMLADETVAVGLSFIPTVTTVGPLDPTVYLAAYTFVVCP